MEINIGEQLKKIRIEKQLTQEELGLKLFLTRQTISKWETGKSLPDLENLILLCQFYEISLDELVGLNTLNFSTQNIKQGNRRKEFFHMLTRNSKIFLSTAAALLAILFSYSFIEQHALTTSTGYADSFLIYRVKTIEYENNKPTTNQSKGKIKSITLLNNEIIEPVTLEKIKKHELTNKLKYGNLINESNDGIRISLNQL